MYDAVAVYVRNRLGSLAAPSHALLVANLGMPIDVALEIAVAGLAEKYAGPAFMYVGREILQYN